MNFDRFWETNDIWKYDPYVSDDLHGIEKRCAEYGWVSCKQEILDILDKYRNSVGVDYAIEEIKDL